MKTNIKLLSNKYIFKCILEYVFKRFFESPEKYGECS